MATVTTTTTPTVTSVTTSWLKLHETLLLAVLVLGTLGYGVERYFDVESAKAKVQVTMTQQALVEAEKNSAALALQASVTASQYQALVQTLSAQNASLQASMAQRTASQKAQVTIDANLPLSGLATRWNQLIPTVTPSVTSVGVGLTAQEAHDTVAQLEQVPVLVQNLSDEMKVASNYQAEVQKSDLLSADLNSQILELNTQITDADKACKAQVASVKADARKGKIKWFKIGFLSGFVSGLWAGHAGL